MLLKLHSEGALVRRLEQALAALGYAPGLVDSHPGDHPGDRPGGRFDKATRSAVVAFQRDRELVVDGLVGPQTLAALGEDVVSDEPPCELTDEAKLHMVDTMSAFEGNFDTCNRDGEYEGRFDRPKRRQGRFLRPEARTKQPSWRPHRYSMYGRGPTHIGLSWGFVQFTQDGGTLGKVLAEMRHAAPERFDEIFGPEAAELVRVTNLRGCRYRVVEPGTPRGFAYRRARVEPVGGADLWQEPWLSRFRRAGREPVFQEVQKRAALDLYFTPMLRRSAIPYGIESETGLTILLDRSIQLGPSGCAKLIRRCWKDREGRTEPELFALLYALALRGERIWAHRVRKLMDSDEISWSKRFALPREETEELEMKPDRCMQ